MRYYLISALFILIGIVVVLTLSKATNFVDQSLVVVEIPQNNSQVAGIQKYNIPPVSQNITPPEFSARSVLVKDLETDTILYQKDASLRLPIASTTKIATALVASEYFQPSSDLTVNRGAEISGAKVGLIKGETLSFRSLLYGMLLNSGNDAAFTIAENYPGGVLGFVSAMNKKADRLGLKNTLFENPAGFDNVQHYSSASDLAKITEETLKNPQLSRIFATKETNILSLDKKYQHQLHNLNKLLSDVKGVLGVKTGYTQEAKENLVTFVDRDGHKILTVVLGSDDRFGESTKLIEWTYANFIWQDSGIVN